MGRKGVKRRLDGIISALGTLQAITSKIVPKVRSYGVSEEDVATLVKPDSKKVIDDISYGIGKAFRQSRRFDIDARIGALSKMAHWHGDFTVPGVQGYIRIDGRDVALKDTGVIQATIGFVEFDAEMSHFEVLREFKRRGLRPPTFEHAVLFVDQHPDEPGNLLRGYTGPTHLVFPHEPFRVPWNNETASVVLGLFVLEKPHTEAKRYRSITQDRVDRDCRFNGNHMFAYVADELPF